MYCEGRYTKRRGVTYCDAETCDYLLTYRVTPGDIAHFEMSANAGWVAVGFSSDNLMVCISIDPEICLIGRTGSIAVMCFYRATAKHTHGLASILTVHPSDQLVYCDKTR